MEFIEEAYISSITNDSLLYMTNSTLIMESYSTPVLPIAVIVEAIFLVIVYFIGLLGNVLVVYVITRLSKMKTVTNMYIVNLAIANLCCLIGTPFLLVTMIKTSWIFGDIMCKAYFILTNTGEFVSIIFFFIMSVDRYIAVCQPKLAPKFRKLFVYRCVSLTGWLCGSIVIALIVSHVKLEEHWLSNGIGETTSIKLCVLVWAKDFEANNAMTFILLNFAFSFVVPLCLTLVLFCLIIRKLKAIKFKIKLDKKKQSHRKVTNLVLTVVTVHFLCWLPFWILQIMMIFSNEDLSEIFLIVNTLAFCLSYSNLALNPILYALLSDNFKMSVFKTITCAVGKDVNAKLHSEISLNSIMFISGSNIRLETADVKESN